jgi:hypothetical protein
VTFERTFQRVEDAGEELTEEEWAAFESAYGRYQEAAREARASMSPTS